MARWILWVVVPLVILSPVAASGDEDEGDDGARTLAQALTDGELGVTLRYRFENVSDDNPSFEGREGNASTLRTTLSYRSAAFHDFSAFLEFEDVSDLGLEDDHNNAGGGGLWNGINDRPVVADVDDTGINQVYLRYAGLPETTITAGRQEILLGELRFVGNVGWRQNHQSYDAVRLSQGSIPRTKLTYAWIGNVSRIFGDSLGMDTHLLDAEVTVGDAGRLTPYIYLLDYDDLDASGLSTSTYGIRWQGKAGLDSGWSIPYHAELARQRDAGDNPFEVDAGYLHLQVGAAADWLWFKAGYELQEGSTDEGRFTTPLATLHAWNGWADKFLVTPPLGLEDVYITVGGKHGDLAGVLVYHQFASDEDSIDYGTEIDGQLTYTAPWKQIFGLKLAFYDADDFSFDTDKIMVWTSYGF